MIHLTDAQRQWYEWQQSVNRDLHILHQEIYQLKEALGQDASRERQHDNETEHLRLLTDRLANEFHMLARKLRPLSMSVSKQAGR